MIDIFMENNGKFQDVALLVDQDMFIERVEGLRKILGINSSVQKPYHFNSPESKWSTTFSNNWYEQKLRQMNKYFLTNEKLAQFETWFASSDIFNLLLKKYNPYSYSQAIHDASINLLNTFKKSDNFLPAIQAAIITNTVREQDYESYIFTEYAANIADTSKLLRKEREKHKIPQEGKWLALFFQPYTTREEINNILDMEFNKYKIKEPIISSAIQNHREWYWKHKELHSYEKVARSYEKNEYNARTIENGVKGYKKLLNTYKV